MRSSSPSATATPPWARSLLESRSESLLSTATEPDLEASMAALSPATPLPMTM